MNVRAQWRRVPLLVAGLLCACPRAAPVPAVPAVSEAPPDEGRVATVVSVGGVRGSLLACVEPGGAECVVPRCEGACASFLATAVGAAVLAEGPVVLPRAVVALEAPPPEPCAEVDASPVGDETVHETGRVAAAVTPDPGALPEGFAVDAAYALDGDGTAETVVEGTVDGRYLAGVLGSVGWVTVAEEVVVTPDDPEDPQQAFDAEIASYTSRVVGVTDVGLDGTLDLLVEGSGYEAVWSAALVVTGGRVVVTAKVGCAN